MHGRSPVAKMAARLLHPLIPNSVYMIDDGTAEDAVAWGNGVQNDEALWFNQFDVIAGQTMISTVSVAWGTPVFPDPAMDGTPVTIAIWSDPNGDGDPSDGVLLGSVAGTIQNSGTDTFIDYTFSPPVDVSAFTSFFVGDMTPMNNGPEHFFQGIDENNPLHRQSWIAAMSSGGPVDINNIGNNDTIGLIDDFGIPGNWLIRADTGGGGTPTPTPTGSPGCTPGPWNFVANMPTDLYGAAGASDGTFFYAAGGYSFSQGNTLDTLYRYDPATDSWTTLAPMPQAAIMASAVYYPTTNTIYVFGGEDANTGTNYNITRIYDITADTWITGANMPDVRSFMASGYSPTNGKIYLVSGYNTGQVTSAQPDMWEYDPVANTFTSRAPIPHSTGGAAFGVINGHLYVAGGRDATNTVINL